MVRRLRLSPIGSTHNFDIFRSAPKSGARKRYSIVFNQKPTASHSLRVAKKSLLANKIKSMYPNSASKQIVANELVSFVVKNPTAAKADIFTNVLSKLRPASLKIEHTSIINGKKKVYLKELSAFVVAKIYEDLISSKGVLKRTIR
jgi:hypothetical protein